MAIPADTTMGPVRLTVADLDGVRAFYEQKVGLRLLQADGDVVRLGANGSPTVELVGHPEAPPRPRVSTGLFHLAILLPSRLDLAIALRRLVDQRWPLSGASDHLVSEALYLRDPEGNGIEIYRDRPREQWPRTEGELQMATLPLDLDSVIGELAGTEDAAAGVPAATHIGHVHLQVSDLEAAETFYHDTLGFEVMVRGYPGALFLSAGGYHHHIGLNTWAGESAPPPPTGSRGLRSFEVLLPSADELGHVEGRLREAGIEAERQEDGIHTSDPSGNAILLAAPPG